MQESDERISTIYPEGNAPTITDPQVGTSSAMPSTDTISLIDLLLKISYAKDVHSQALISGVSPQHENLELLQTHISNILKIVINQFSLALQQKIIAMAKKLAEVGIGNALTLVKPFLNEILAFKERILEKLTQQVINRQTDFTHNSYIGIQLFRKLPHIIESKFRDKIDNEMPTRKLKLSKEKISETEKHINEIFIEFSDHKDLMSLSIPIESFDQSFQQLSDLLDIVVEEFGLGKIKSASLAFEETLTVNKTTAKHLFSEEEVIHFAQLINEYYREFGSASPTTVVDFMHNLHKIKPLLEWEAMDYIKLVDNSTTLTSKLEFISRHFQVGSRIRTAYEALGLATSAYLHLLTAIQEMKALLIKKGKKPESEALKQLDRYYECITRYFQLPTRFVMPIKELIQIGRAIEKMMKNPADNASEEVKKRAKDNADSLGKSLTDLTACQEILKMHTKSIDAFQSIQIYIDEITQCLEKSQARSSISTFFSQVSSYIKVLKELKTYFIQVQGSRNEEHTNFRGILQKIEDLCHQNRVKVSSTEQSSEEHKLISKIHNYYLQQVKQFQEDIQPCTSERELGV